MLLYICLLFSSCRAQQLFPDGKEVPSWFENKDRIDINTLGQQYIITDYGCVNDSNIIQTSAIQEVIDKAAQNGGGVIVIPDGTFLTGSLFFKAGTHLYVQQGGVLKGSDRIWDFSLLDTRIEGQSIKYFAALINADHVDDFSILGNGTINGNGWAYWKEFWIRRLYKPQCTNLEAMRPRLVYVSNSKNVTIQDIHLKNSPFWTNHIYKCEKVRFLNCSITAPCEGVYNLEPQRGAPSSDGIDIDVCHDILINGCIFSVNDDAIALKGGKGTYADQDDNNGTNQDIIIEKCNFGRALSCLTIGSESLYDRNIILRNSKCENTTRVLRLKFRPDTPQHFEYVKVDNISGNVNRFLSIQPWTQFYEEIDRDDMPISGANNFLFSDLDIVCNRFYDVGLSDKYSLKDFSFCNSSVTDASSSFNKELIEGTIVDSFVYNGECLECTSNIKQPLVQKSGGVIYSLNGIPVYSGFTPYITVSKGKKNTKSTH